jgi:hypothetical protein
MKQIKEGEPQPLPCKHCKTKEGYQVTQKIERYYDLIFDGDGFKVGGVYSDMEKVKIKYKKASCPNCQKELPFTVA